MSPYCTWRGFAGLVLIAATLASHPVCAQTLVDAADLVLPFTELRNTAEGQQALEDNITTIFTIQNGATRAEQLQAIKDATRDTHRASSVADGLGPLFQSAYFSAIFAGNAALLEGGSIHDLFKNRNSHADNLLGYIKTNFGDGTPPPAPSPPAEIDVYGRSYLTGTIAERDAKARELNDQLNPRPFQIAQDDPSYQIVTFSGPTFKKPGPGGNSTVGPVYSNVEINQGVINSASFLSGHTTYAYTSTILFAMMVPERYQELMLRASDFANGRLIMGAHYPLDLIGGRTLATYALAHWLAEADSLDELERARSDLQEILTTGSGAASFEQAVADQGSWSQAELDAARTLYAYRMTYGLPNVGTTGDDAPANSHYLLITRFPYLNEAQRTEVIRTTMLADAGPLANSLADYQAWTRINLFDAAGGYGALDADTTVIMNAANGGLHAYDTWNNDIGGTERLIKQGTGTLVLSGANTFGGVDVQQGVLALSGTNTFSGASQVGGSGETASLLLGPSLSGTTLTVGAQGTLGRVGGYGATNIGGDLALNAGSTTTIRFAGPSSFDSFIVSGSTQVDPGTAFGMLTVGDYVPPAPGAQLTILTSGGLTGQFDTVSLPDTFAIRYELLQDGDRLYVQANSVPFLQAARTPDQVAAANYIDAVLSSGPSDSMQTLTNALRKLPTAAAVGAALDQLGPETYANAELSGLYSSLAFANSLLSCRVNGKDTASIIREGQCLWAGASAVFYDAATTAREAGFSQTTGLFAGGVQVALDEVWRLGFGASYQTSSLAATTGTTTQGAQAQGGIALKYNPGPLLVAATLSAGRNWAETTRPLSFPGFAATAESAPGIDIVNGGARLAYVFGAPQLYLKPVLDAAATHLDLGGFTESGAGAANLAVKGTQQTVYTIAPSLEVGTEWWWPNGTLVRPFLRGGAAWYEGNDFALSAGFVDAPAGIAPFTIITDRDDVMALVGAGIDVISGGDTVLHLAYDGQLGETTQIHAVALKGSARF